VWRGQQAVHLLLVSVRALVLNERIDFAGRWRKTGEIQAYAAQQRDTIGFGRWRESFLFKPREDEVIDWIFRPCCVFDRWQRGAFWRNEGPVRFGGRDFRADVIGPLGALVDPGFYRGDLIVGETAAHWHANDISDAGDALIEMAAGRIAGDDNLRENGLLRVQPQTRHLGVRAVAHDA